MKINLKEKNMELTVNTYGAYIEKFTKEKKPIFFPKLLIKIKNELKTRGGMHPCLPNFGKSEIKKLDQHGFGRISFWDIEEKTENSVKLKLEGKGEYEKYLYPHDYDGSYVDQKYMPDNFKGKKYYEPKDIAYEIKIKEYLDSLK